MPNIQSRDLVIYGCESWPLKKSDEPLLVVFERKVLRTIFGGIREGESWRRRYNFELERDFAEPNIVAVVKVRWLTWAGHLARMNDDRALATLFRNNPEGRRGVGRPRTRWIDGIENDLRANGIRNWQDAAQDRRNWNGILEQPMAHRWL